MVKSHSTETTQIFVLTAQILIAAVLITYACSLLGRKAGIVDIPGGRKQHRGEIPLVGGIAFFFTVLWGSWALDILVFTPTLLWVALIPFLIGVYDDKVHIRPWLRLGIHYCCGILMASIGGVAIHNVGNLLTFGDIPLLALTIPLTALSVAGLCNACNMIDGIDGLAASQVGLPLLMLYLLALSANHPTANALLLMLIPIGVFLCFNLGPNRRWLPKIFLGDGGSVTLGFMLTASLVYFSQGEARLIKPVSALWMVTVPLMDMLATMMRRIKHGENPMVADNQHLHHILMRLGLSARQTLLCLLVYAAGCASLGLWLEKFPASFSLLVYFCLFVAHCIFVVKTSSSQFGKHTDIPANH